MYGEVTAAWWGLCFKEKYKNSTSHRNEQLLSKSSSKDFTIILSDDMVQKEVEADLLACSSSMGCFVTGRFNILARSVGRNGGLEKT